MKIIRYFLVSVIISALFLSGCIGLSFSTTVPVSEGYKNNPPVKTTVPMTDREKNLAVTAFNLVNDYRLSRGLSALIWDDSIALQCYKHSKNMADEKVPFSHQGFDDRMKAIFSVISASGIAENVAYNNGYSDPARIAVESWIQSPGHHANIIGNYDLSAMAVSINKKGDIYFTQIFVLQR